MSGNHSRRKGSSAELELARLIHHELDVRMQRRVEQVRSGGYDLEIHPDEHSPVAEQLARYGIECKRAAEVSPHLVVGWWRQTWAQAAAADRVPCLAYRGDRQDWSFVVPLQELHPDMPAAAADSLDCCAALTLRGWAVLVQIGAASINPGAEVCDRTAAPSRPKPRVGPRPNLPTGYP